MARTFPTYETPQGPVRDFIRYLAEDTEPPKDQPLAEAIAHARQTIAEGGDFLCDMGDGLGPRHASKILDEMEAPARCALLFERIRTDLRQKVQMLEAANDVLH
ncbi:hypothetical protein [Paracoccus actinidiae]|jgi:hypothetical protein|uniref:hypothetical protein n=1 Tax=Paracoccus actinidiae TaxID=3064531 RepID=UPI0027D260CA|nr:hypothetical protein [Paracoccus sp. M09]